MGSPSEVPVGGHSRREDPASPCSPGWFHVLRSIQHSLYSLLAHSAGGSSHPHRLSSVPQRLRGEVLWPGLEQQAGQYSLRRWKQSSAPVPSQRLGKLRTRVCGRMCGSKLMTSREWLCLWLCPSLYGWRAQSAHYLLLADSGPLPHLPYDETLCCHFPDLTLYYRYGKSGPTEMNETKNK